MSLDTDDVPPEPRRVRPAAALWWALIAAAVVVAGLLLFRSEPHRTAPAERNATLVTHAPIELPAAR